MANDIGGIAGDRLAEEEALYTLYKSALGEFMSTPLGAAAMRAVEPAAA